MTFDVFDGLLFVSSSDAAMSSFKEQVESLQNLDQSVEILIRLLCAVPGWGEKNVQVYSFTGNGNEV